MYLRDVNWKESAKSWESPQSSQASDCKSWGSAWRRFAQDSPATRSSEGAVSWTSMWASCTQMSYYEFRCCCHWISLLILLVCYTSIWGRWWGGGGGGGEKASKALRISSSLFFFPLGSLAYVHMSYRSFQFLGFGSFSDLIVSFLSLDTVVTSVALVNTEDNWKILDVFKLWK